MIPVAMVPSTSQAAAPAGDPLPTAITAHDTSSPPMVQITALAAGLLGTTLTAAGQQLQDATPSADPPAPTDDYAATTIHWTVATVFQTLAVFVFAGLAEISGGWLVWQGIRNGKPWYYILGGCAVLVAYGFIPTLQPEGAAFARVYAVYGGIFIAMSYAWGWVLDGDRPDVGDWVGTAIAVAGVALAWFWPR